MTTVFNKAVAGDDGGGDNNQNLRIQVVKANLSAGSGTQCQLTIITGSAAFTSQLYLDTAYFGQTDQVANSITFNGNQRQVKWSGGSASLTTAGGNGTTGTTVVSDVFTLGETYDVTKNYLMSCHIPNAATVPGFSTLSLANTDTFNKAGTDESSVTTPTGSYSQLAAQLFLLNKVDVTAAGGGAKLRRNSSLSGLGASGPFFHDPLAGRSQLGWRPSLVAVKRKLIVPSRHIERLAA